MPTKIHPRVSQPCNEWAANLDPLSYPELSRKKEKGAGDTLSTVEGDEGKQSN